MPRDEVTQGVWCTWVDHNQLVVPPPLSSHPFLSPHFHWCWILQCMLKSLYRREKRDPGWQLGKRAVPLQQHWQTARLAQTHQVTSKSEKAGRSCQTASAHLELGAVCLHIWKSNLRSMLSKRFVLRTFFFFLPNEDVPQMHRHSEQAREHWSSTMEWEKSRNSNLLQEVLRLSDTERLVISRL